MNDNNISHQRFAVVVPVVKALTAPIGFSSYIFLNIIWIISQQAAMVVWLGTHISNWLAIWLATFPSLVVGFRPHFQSVWSRPLCNCFVKKINQGTDVLTHNCLPPLLALCALKHVCTRLIILTGCKNNHKIKIDVASWQSAFTPSTPNTF